MPTAISNLPELKEYIAQLFDRRDIVFSDFGEHQTMFSVAGKARSVYAFLLQKTEQALWSDGDGYFFAYKNEPENFLITLSPAPKMVLVTASVLSLHDKYLAKFDDGHTAATHASSARPPNKASRTKISSPNSSD